MWALNLLNRREQGQVCPPGMRILNQVELFEVVSEDGVFHSCEDQADVLRVGGTGEVRVDAFVFVFVLLLVHLKNKLLGCLWIIFGAWKMTVISGSMMWRSVFGLFVYFKMH